MQDQKEQLLSLDGKTRLDSSTLIELTQKLYSEIKSSVEKIYYREYEKQRQHIKELLDELK